MPIAVPISALASRQIRRFRENLERACLRIEEIDETQWRVSAASGRHVLYFPVEDRWRDGSTWGRGTLTLIEALREKRA